MENLTAEYIVYPAPNGVANWFIHEYPNGRKVLVEVDPITGKETFIRQL
jgi:hypothetical protein